MNRGTRFQAGFPGLNALKLLPKTNILSKRYPKTAHKRLETGVNVTNLP